MKSDKTSSKGPGHATADPFIVSPPAGQPEKPAATSRPLRILYLEDDRADADLAEGIMLKAGMEFTLRVVSDRVSFQDELRRYPPGVILSDFSLPGFDGAHALEIARHQAPTTPFIFVTGVLGEEVVIDMIHKGATDMVFKNRLTRLPQAVALAVHQTELRRESQRAQERLRRSHDQLKALTGHLQFVREEERARIALEVHDELGQALTVLKLDLSWLSGRLPRERALQKKIKVMSDHVDETIQTVRRIATELRPGVLDSLGLSAAIEWQTMDFQERTGIKCDVTIDLKEPIRDRDFSTVCFRILQETLTNIIRHSDATQVEVRLAQVDQEVTLTVRDNGRGISEKDVAHPRSIGLIGMRERVAQVGGEMFFFGLPGRGTTVTMRVPLPKAPAFERTL
jgi:signal transduction histidine kinase